VVVPDQPVGALTDLARPLLGVDDEHARPAHHQVIQVRVRAWDGQVVEDHVAVAGQAVQQPGGVALALAAAPPRARLLGGAEPQPPANQHRGSQAGQPGPRQAGLGSKHGGGDPCGADQRCPPGQAAGPSGQLERAPPPIGDQGGAAGATVAAGDWLGERRRGPSRRGPGTSWGCPGGSRAAQPLPSSRAG